MRLTEQLQEQWRAEQVPSVEGVVFANGSAVSIRSKVQVSSGAQRIILERDGLLELDEIVASSDFFWIPVTPLVEHVWKEMGLIILAGEGSMGADGFVAVCDCISGDFVWVALFFESNPFRAIAVIDGDISATSTLGDVWRFPLKSPEAVGILIK